MNLLVKRFGKYLKRKGIKGNPKRYTSKHDESNSSNFTCYNCGKKGHIKIECPNANKEKEKTVERKKEKKPKEKRAYIAWEDNDYSTTSSSSQDESEETNLCLMVGYESSSSSQVSSLDLNDYNQLLHDFEELLMSPSLRVRKPKRSHAELMKLPWRRMKVRKLEEERRSVRQWCLEKLSSEVGPTLKEGG